MKRRVVAGVLVMTLAVSIQTMPLQTVKAAQIRMEETEQLLAEAQDDNALLRSKLDAKANISYIEEYASEKLGMTKITSAQKEYISINENLIEVEQDETEGFIGSVRKWFSHTLEYMGF